MNRTVHTSPQLGGMPLMATHVDTEADRHLEISIEHGRIIRAFAAFFNLDTDDVRLVDGEAATVLPDMARSLDAGLVVMHARSLGRWERVFSAVSAEPVLAQAHCDVLFVKTETEIDETGVERGHAARHARDRSGSCNSVTAERIR